MSQVEKIIEKYRVLELGGWFPRGASNEERAQILINSDPEAFATRSKSKLEVIVGDLYQVIGDTSFTPHGLPIGRTVRLKTPDTIYRSVYLNGNLVGPSLSHIDNADVVKI